MPNPINIFRGAGLKLLYSFVPIPLLFRGASLSGTIRSLVSKKRHALIRLLASLFGHEKTAAEIRLIARRHFQYLQRRDLAWIWPQLQGFAHSQHCPIEGLHHIDAALSQGNGAILLTAHFGYGRLIKPLLRKRQYPVLVVGPQIVKEPGQKPSRRRIYRNSLLRLPRFSASKDNDLPTGLNVRPLVDALRRNQLLVMTADGLRASTLVCANLLGELVPFASGPFSLAKGTGAQILPTFVVDSEADAIGIKVVIQEPMAIADTGRPKCDLQSNIDRFAQHLESFIRHFPHLYLYIHGAKSNRFKRRLSAMKVDVADRHRGRFWNRTS
jgi:KDO2-lipid IV(A) lauroyltransferase